MCKTCRYNWIQLKLLTSLGFPLVVPLPDTISPRLRDRIVAGKALAKKPLLGCKACHSSQWSTDPFKIPEWAEGWDRPQPFAIHAKVNTLLRIYVLWCSIIAHGFWTYFKAFHTSKIKRGCCLCVCKVRWPHHFGFTDEESKLQDCRTSTKWFVTCSKFMTWKLVTPKKGFLMVSPVVFLFKIWSLSANQPHLLAQDDRGWVEEGEQACQREQAETGSEAQEWEDSEGVFRGHWGHWRGPKKEQTSQGQEMKETHKWYLVMFWNEGLKYSVVLKPVYADDDRGHLGLYALVWWPGFAPSLPPMGWRAPICNLLFWHPWHIYFNQLSYRFQNGMIL